MARFFYCKSCKLVSTSRMGGMEIPRGFWKKRVEERCQKQFKLDSINIDYKIKEAIRQGDDTRVNGRLVPATRKCPYCAVFNVNVDVVLVEKTEEEKKDDTDDNSKLKIASEKEMEAFHRASDNLIRISDRSSNIQVGDFVSELASAIRFRMKPGQPEGDWLDEPVRAYTDGLVFAEEQTVASSVRLQIVLALDVSSSMWRGRIPIESAGPAFATMDKMIRKAIKDLPEGAVAYAPFVFAEEAYELPEAFMGNYSGTMDKIDGKPSNTLVIPKYPFPKEMEEARRLGQIPANANALSYRLAGGCTKLTPLFEAIKEWEDERGSPDGVRLDIVLTDGQFADTDDITQATKVQEDRNGKLRSIFLNFTDFASWSKFKIPNRCSQFAVTPESLDTTIREILSESIRDML